MSRNIGILNYKGSTGKITTPIRSNVRLAEAPAYQTTISEYAPRSYGAQNYA